MTIRTAPQAGDETTKDRPLSSGGPALQPAE
jgi:hypothetical protein